MNNPPSARRARCWQVVLVSGSLTLALCVFGMFSATGPGQVDEYCRGFLEQDFDLAYWLSHHQDSLLPPYSNPCSAQYDMVPGWLDPAITVAAALCGLLVTSLVVERGARWTRGRIRQSGRGPRRPRERARGAEAL